MNVVFLFPFIILFFALTCDLLSIVEKRKIICWIFFLGSTFLIGFRSVYTGGVDTLTVYSPIFEQLSNESFIAVCTHFLFRDPLFYISTKLFTIVTSNFQAYLFTIALFVSASISYFVYKFSPFPVLSFSLFMLLQYFGFEFQMIKHAIAFSILLFSYPYLFRNQCHVFIAIVVLAGLFHVSAFIFLLAYPIRAIRPQVLHFFGLMFFMFIILCCRAEVLTLLSLLFQSERFQMYFDPSYVGRLPLTGFFIALLVLLFSFFITPKKIQTGEEFTSLFNMSYISCLVLLGVVILGESIRLSMFFGMANLILMPFSIQKSSIHNKKIAVYAISLICILHFSFFGIENAGLDNYSFFWQ